MAKEFSRSRRVGDLIQKELSAIIRMPVMDAGLGLVTISAVDLSRDLSYARIYVTCLGIDLESSEESELDNKSDQAKILSMLDGNAPQFRHQLSKNLTTRIVPKLKFMFDESLEQANRLTSLIDSLRTDEPEK